MKMKAPKDKEPKGNMSFFKYFSNEITHGYFLDENDLRYTERRQRVYTFLKQPIEIEKMMTFGIFLCLDAFLYMFTFLPLRIGLAFIKIFSTIFRCIRRTRPSWLDPSQKCDILKALIFVITAYFMSYIDTSFIYHLVRAQTLIKLYIIYNMLEVADRLFSSFGQDILDALFWTATESHRGRSNFFRILLHIFLAVVYVFSHTILVLFEATTINVAFNSHNKVLLTVMMANNFVEIKGTVFKKYDKNNLFQISCSDVRERFHYYALLFVVLLRNMQQYSWSYEHFSEIVPHMLTVLFSEYLVDWFKHAFVLKFNHIPIESYNEYRATLAYDLINSRQKHSIADHSDIVSRRMGFIPLPLSVLIFHITRISVDFNGTAGRLVIAVGLLILTLIKVLNNIILMGKSCQYIDDDVAKAKKSDSEISVVDPFEQRGAKTIILEKSQKQKPMASVLATTSVQVHSKIGKSEFTSVQTQPMDTVVVRPIIGRDVESTGEENQSEIHPSSDNEFNIRKRHKPGDKQAALGDSPIPIAIRSSSLPSSPTKRVKTISPNKNFCSMTQITTPAKARSMRPPSIDMTMMGSAASLTNLTSLDEVDSKQSSSSCKESLSNSSQSISSSLNSGIESIEEESQENTSVETLAETVQ